YPQPTPPSAPELPTNTASVCSVCGATYYGLRHCVPEPQPITAEECEQALKRGDVVRVKCASGAVGVYRIRLGELRFRHGADWLKSTAGISMILEDVRNGAKCFLVREGE